jgi:hypothetical protein
MGGAVEHERVGDTYEREAMGKDAYATLERLILRHWETLTPTERAQLAVAGPDEIAKSIRDLLSKNELMLERRTVEARRRRYERAGQQVPLHLQADGPAAEREASGPARRPLRLTLPRRLDDSEMVLAPFARRDLSALKTRIRKLRQDLDRLEGTTLAKLVTATAEYRRCMRDTRAGLDWYERQFLPELIQLAKSTGTRKLPGMRRRVVGVLAYLKLATGDDCVELVCDLLNWLVPWPDGRAWTVRTLRRWRADGGRTPRRPPSRPPRIGAS